jgi:hypothetical protein
MKYFKVSLSTNIKEIGSYPQIQSMTKNYDYDSNSSVYRLNNFKNKIPEFKPNLNSFVLDNHAKPTDVLSSAFLGSFGILINSKINKILSQFKLINHTKYLASVYFPKDDSILEYYWLHFLSNLEKKIDYKESFFYSSGKHFLTIPNYESYIEQKDSLGKFKKLYAKEIVIKEKFIKHYDLFNIPEIDSSIYISEKLKNVLVKENVTGVDIDQQKILKIEVD